MFLKDYREHVGIIQINQHARYLEISGESIHDSLKDSSRVIEPLWHATGIKISLIENKGTLLVALRGEIELPDPLAKLMT